MKNYHHVFVLFFLIFSQTLPAQTPAAPEMLMSEMNWKELAAKSEALLSVGKNEQGLSFARASLEVARRDSGEASLAFGISLGLLGYALHHTGKFAEAETNLRAGVAHALQHLGDTSEAYIERLINLGMLRLTMGDHAQSTSDLETVVRLSEQHLSESHPFLAIGINNLGLAYEQAGRFDLALQYYLRALDLTERTLGKEHFRYGIRLTNVAAAYRYARDFEKALDFARRGLANYEKSLGKNHIRYLNGLSILQTTCLAAGRNEEALSLCDTMLAIARQTGIEDKFQFYELADGFSRSYFLAGQYERCFEFSRDLLQKFQPMFPKSFAMFIRDAGYATAALEKLGRLTEAAEFALLHNRLALNELLQSFRLFSEEEQLSFYRNSLQWSHKGQLVFALRHPEIGGVSGAAFDYQMNVKGLSLSNRNQLLNTLRDDPKSGGLTAQFADWQQLQTQISRQNSLPPAKRNANLDSLENRSNKLERSLAIGSETFRLAKQTARWQDVQAALPPASAAIEFARIPLINSALGVQNDSLVYCAWVLRSGTAEPQRVLLFEEKDMPDLAATRLLYDPLPPAEGKNLRQLVWEKLEPVLHDVSKIWYAPAGLLHQINLGAVPISATEVFADRFELHRLVSTRSILDLKNEHSPWVAPADVLVFGGIRYEIDSFGLAETQIRRPDERLPSEVSRGAGFGENWTFLEGSSKEAADARSRLSAAGAKVVFAEGFAASEDFFKKTVANAASPQVLHLATHGFFQTKIDTGGATGFAAAKNPMARAGLVLAGANRAWHGELPLVGKDDGILTALEITNLDLKNTQLAVLSACGTGLGKTQAGEGVLGLQRAFKMAGTKYIIMTLWNVNDRHAQEFMQFFYEAWLSRKMTIPNAFRSAQRRMRAAYLKPFQPAAWAGFVLLE